MSFGIYVHWPYCARICPYCDFNVYRARGQDEGELLGAILADIRGHRERIGPRVAETLFLGGGTPSLLSEQGIARLIETARESFALAPDAEITIEANPDERDGFASFVSAGVNRISIGVQSLRDDALQGLGRLHDAAAARAAVEAAANTGARVSLDLIYARPQQGLADWRAELGEALKLPAEHLSLYQLTIETGTAFGRAVRRGNLSPPDAERAAQLYELTQEMCAAAGAPAYEVSNHARGAAAEARHNLIYWRGGEWIGVGPGAHGRVEGAGSRAATAAFDAPYAYCAAVAKHGVGWESAVELSPEQRAQEALAMGLRVSEGVARAAIAPVLDESKTAMLESEGLVTSTADRLTLTSRGRLVADRIAAELQL